MKVINKINKRLVKDKIRMFFEIENVTVHELQEGKLMLEMPIDIVRGCNLRVNINPIAAKSFGFVYYDVPRSLFGSLYKFDWILTCSLGMARGSGVLTNKFENLYEG